MYVIRTDTYVWAFAERWNRGDAWIYRHFAFRSTRYSNTRASKYRRTTRRAAEVQGMLHTVVGTIHFNQDLNKL
jgi:hypothetical protein